MLAGVGTPIVELLNDVVELLFVLHAHSSVIICYQFDRKIHQKMSIKNQSVKHFRSSTRSEGQRRARSKLRAEIAF